MIIFVLIQEVGDNGAKGHIFNCVVSRFLRLKV